MLDAGYWGLMPEMRAKFWEFYWGKLLIVEDADLEAAMIQLGDVLEMEKEEERRAESKTRSRRS